MKMPVNRRSKSTLRQRQLTQSAVGPVVERLETRTLLASWTPMVRSAPSGLGTMMLMTDGTVMSSDGSFGWNKLVPDAAGNYINGTWTRAANMRDSRLYEATQVLKDGRLFIAGGEYGTGSSTGEVFDPNRNIWTALPAHPFGSFSDSGSFLLPDGRVLISPVSPNPGGYTTLFNPTTMTWALGPKLVRGNSTDEQSFVKLPDDSVLTVDSNTTSERYIPSQNKWINDGAVPVALFDGLTELGPGFRLSDGRAFFVGGTGKSALYTPSGSTAPGTWVAGPSLPAGLGIDDGPGAVLPDANILFATGPTGTYNGPSSLFIYNPTTNAFTAVAGAPSFGSPPYVMRMLDLPNGTVLVSGGGATGYIYNPAVAPLAIAQPTITDVTPNADGTVQLTGTGINGISAGAGYGDDAQMDSNYPIVRLTSGTNVYYARTYNWSSTGVATGATPETTQFTLPVGIPAGTYTVAVIANGIASSNTVPLTISMTAGNAAPTVATAIAYTAPTTTTSLSVLGADDAGEANLTYTWSTVSSPSAYSTPSFSANRTNAAKNILATFYSAGTYTFSVTVTDAGGLSVTNNVTIVVPQIKSSIAINSTTVNLTSGASQQFSASELDQFGHSMTTTPSYVWSVVSGGGTITAAGKYTTPATGALVQIRVTDGALQANITVYVVSKPWTSIDVGGPALAGSAYDTSNIFHVAGAGNDIWNTSDQFHFVYQTLTGDGIITAHVASLSNTDASAKSGVMIRNTTAPDDAMVFMALTPSSGAVFQYRTASTATAAAGIAAAGITAPYWVRLERSGDTFYGYRSANGVNWTLQDSITISMNAKIDIGLEVTSHNTGAINTTTFDHVAVSQLTLVTAASATPNPVTGTTTNLSVLGADAGGESSVKYTWAATTVPTGATAPTFDINGTNTAKNAVATFSQPGSYVFTVTISDGTATLTSTVSVDVNATLTTLVLTPASAFIQFSTSSQFSTTGTDQFGAPLDTTGLLTWSITSADSIVDNTGLVTAGTTAGTYTVSATNGTLTRNATVTIAQAGVANRALFYNNSSYDGNDPLPDFTTDAAAIATDKQALLPGHAATFDNYSSYYPGINGIILDIVGLPTATTLLPSDFTFLAGTTADIASWTPVAVAPTITIFPTKGLNGSDRVELIWPDRTIVNQWLQLTINPTMNTGFAAPDVCYFGSLVGDIGNNPDTATSAAVTISDIAATKSHNGEAATITSPFDFNRNGSITISDIAISKSQNGSSLLLITAPAAPVPHAATAPVATRAPAPSSAAPAIAVHARLPKIATASSAAGRVLSIVPIFPKAQGNTPPRKRDHVFDV
jgi:hypothetical protein